MATNNQMLLQSRACDSSELCSQFVGVEIQISGALHSSRLPMKLHSNTIPTLTEPSSTQMKNKPKEQQEAIADGDLTTQGCTGGVTHA